MEFYVLFYVDPLQTMQQIIFKKIGEKHKLCRICNRNRIYKSSQPQSTSETKTTTEIQPLYR